MDKTGPPRSIFMPTCVLSLHKLLHKIEGYGDSVISPRRFYYCPSRKCSDVRAEKRRCYKFETACRSHFSILDRDDIRFTSTDRSSRASGKDRAMDRLRVWMETRHQSGAGDSSIHSASSMSGYYRPPPLRTTNTYDDDDVFNKLALNLLSRYGALGLSAKDTLHATLLAPQDRASFLEALLNRKGRLPALSPQTASLIHDVDRLFGHELKAIVDSEHVTLKRQNYHGSTSSSSGDSMGNVNRDSCNNCSSATGGGGVANKKCKSRRFFPESGEPTSVFFRSRRVQNIDWKLVEMTQQVQSLQLDGSTASTPATNVKYEPPIV
jgi:hypothetical protein